MPAGTGAIYCSPECRVRALRERGDEVVRSQLARVIQAVEMLGVELETLIDLVAATSQPKGRRR